MPKPGEHTCVNSEKMSFFFAVVVWSLPLGEVILTRGTVFSYLYSEISIEIGYLFLFYLFSSLFFRKTCNFLSYPCNSE